MPPARPELSIVIPVCNEEENVPELFEEIKAALEPKGITYEIIFVDDGSRDRSPEIISDLAAKSPCVRAVLFRRNFGQTAAMAAGVDHASGEILVFMDADRQNDPADIPAMLAKLKEGNDVVCGWRKNRQDKTLSRKIPSKIANWLTRKVAKVTIHDLGCSLKCFRMDLMREVKLYGEMHRFIPVFANAVGANIAEVETHHRPRTKGVTKYGLKRTFKVVLDLLTVTFILNYFRRPMHFFGGIGFFLLIAGVLAGLVSLTGRVSATAAAVLIPASFNFFLMGLLAEILMRTYFESQAKPAYKVRKTIGWATPKKLKDLPEGLDLRVTDSGAIRVFDPAAAPVDAAEPAKTG